MTIKKTANAPYNFIPLPENVLYRYDSEASLPKHSSFDKSLKSGCIHYSINTHSATLIGMGDPNGKFFEVNGKYTIPGSTVRGLIRTNAEILSDAYPMFIENNWFTYREVGSRAQFSTTKDYRQMLSTSTERRINQVVKAGLIYKFENRYYIKPLNGYTYENNRYNFYRIKDDVIKLLAANPASGFTKNMSLVERDYKPYIVKVAFNSVHDMKVIKLGEAQPKEYKNLGYLLNSKAFRSGDGKRDKKSHYLFRAETSEAMTDKAEIAVSNQLIAAYETQFKKTGNRANKRERTAYDEVKQKQVVFYEPEYYELPTKNVHSNDLSVEALYEFNTDQVKPVFFLDGYDSKTKVKTIEALGFTPQMRLPFRYGIRDGLQNLEEMNGIDYPNALFGFANGGKNNETSYKGRVYFRNAQLVMEGNRSPETMALKKALISPRPTSFQLYLEQKEGSEVDEKDLTSYNTKDFRLRGHKHYWLKQQADLTTNDANHAARMKPIVENVSFKGQIHFENLNDDELGLLLYAINPFEEGFANIGQGKPYGFGRVKLEVEGMTIFENSRFTAFEPQNKTKWLRGEFLEQEIEILKTAYERRYEAVQGHALDDIQNSRFWAFYMAKNLIVSGNSVQEHSYMTELRRFARDREILPSMKERLEQYEEYQRLKRIEAQIEASEANLQQIQQKNIKEAVEKAVVHTLVITPTKGDENLLRMVLADVDYITYQSYGQLISEQVDVILFNNFEDPTMVEELIEQDKNEKRVYLYFTLHDKRLKPIKGKYIHFSNNIITLKDNLNQATSFAKAVKGGGR